MEERIIEPGTPTYRLYQSLLDAVVAHEKDPQADEIDEEEMKMILDAATMFFCHIMQSYGIPKDNMLENAEKFFDLWDEGNTIDYDPRN